VSTSNRGRQVLVLLSGLLLSAPFHASTAQASGVEVGIGGGPPSGFGGDEEEGIAVGSSEHPIGFYLDPSGGRWSKEFTIDIVDSDKGLENGETLSVVESLLLVPTALGVPVLPWSDWHEEIIEIVGAGSQPWQWVDGKLSVPDLGFATSCSVSTDGRSLWCDVEPPIVLDLGAFPNGLPVVIEKTLVYTGDPVFGTASIFVDEYPTTVPEPAALSLLLLLVFALARVGGPAARDAESAGGQETSL